MTRYLVFIDGEAGTTGLQIRERLAGRDDIELLSLGETERKDPGRRAEALNSADVSVLCLPDDAAREAVAMTTNPASKIIDASTAFRTAPGWTYGFPELCAGQRDAISKARLVSNPGCYPTGFLALVRPLVDAGILPRSWSVTVNAISGYTGGGKPMIAEFEDAAAANYTQAPYRIYATALQHKHVPEMRAHAGLDHAPLFAPAVGRYRQGMIVEVPLMLQAMPGAPTIENVRAVLDAAYAGERFVAVASEAETAGVKTLDPEGLNGTNRLKLFVFGAAETRQARLVALLDNLGKGASGAAIQNLNLMLGLDESTHLV